MSEILHNNWFEKNKPEIKTPVPENLKKDLNKETIDKLNILKQAIESWRFNIDLTKSLILDLKNIPQKNQPYILWMIISWLNNEWIKLKSLLNNSVVLESEDEDKQKVNDFENLINSWLSKWNFNIQTLRDAILYRTTSIEEIIKDSSWKQKNQEELKKLKPRDVFYSLLEKYWITLTWWDDFSNQSIENIKLLKDYIWEKIKDSQSDKDFILSYIDDSYLNKWAWFNKNNSVLDYTKWKEEQIKFLTSSVDKLDEDTKVKLWLNSSSWIKQLYWEFTNNPTKSLSKYQNNLATFAIWWLLAFLWFRWNWIFSKLLWVTWIWVIAAWNPWLWEELKKWFEWLKNNVNENKTEPEKSYLYPDTAKLIFDDKKIQQNYNWLIKENDAFLQKDISLLYIFEDEKIKHNPEEIIKKLKPYFGDKITLDNYLEYKELFKQIILQHKLQNWIDWYNKNSKVSIWNFLEAKTSIIQKIDSSNTTTDVWVKKNIENAENSVINKATKEKNNTLSLSEKENITKYYNINSGLISNLESKLNQNYIEIDIYNFLNQYKNYIEKNFWNNLPLDKKEKLKQYITRKTFLLNEYINEKINDVNEKKLNGEEKISELKRQRWVIDEKLNELFEEFNDKILPSVYLYANDYNTLSTDQKKSVEEMLSREIDDSGNFKAKISDWLLDYTFDSFNDFELIDVNDEKYKNINLPKVENITLLNEKDIEIKKEAELYYYASLAALLANDAASFTWAWTVPWAIIWWGYSLTNAFTENEALISMLQELDYVDKDYLTDKSHIDTAIALVWAIPLAWAWIRLTAKSPKIAKFVSKLKPWELTKFNKIKENISQKIWSYFKKSEKTPEVVEDAQSTWVKFYKNEKTWTTYTKTLDWKFINSKWKELKSTPSNIKEVPLENTHLVDWYVNPKLNKLSDLEKNNPERFKKLGDFAKKGYEKVSNFKLIDLIKNTWRKIDDNKMLAFAEKWWYLKGNNLKTVYNITVWEFLTLPKVVKQLWAFWKDFDKAEWVNLLKVIAFWDKNRWAGYGSLRLATIYYLSQMENWIDKQDEELEDFVSYQIFGMSSKIIYEYFF